MHVAAIRSRNPLAADFLIDYDRPIRPALDRWAIDLRGNLNNLSAAPQLTADKREAVPAYMNLAALVVAHVGDLQTAERLSELQLSWLARLASTSGDISILVNALQPWINLGRLRALQRDAEGARPHFLLAEYLRDRRPVQLGPCYLPASAWQLVLTTGPDTPQVLWTVYALEQLKAYLRAGDPGSALAIIPNLRLATPPETHRFIDEGEILALLHSGHAEEALEKAGNARAARLSDEVAFLLHRVTAMARLEQEKHARELAIKLTAVVTRTELQYATPPTLLRQLKVLGLLLETLGEERYALAVYQQGLDICTKHEDEPLHLGFIEGALRLAPSHQASAIWRSARDYLVERSLYSEVRRTHGMNPVLDHVAIRDMVCAVESAAT
jgi:hypothetical protein